MNEYKTIITVVNISKSFDENTLFQNISFDIIKGQSIVILGGSGSGKSVLLRLLTGLEFANEGEITYTIDGKQLEINKVDERRQIWQHCGVVFQNSALFDSYNVLENLVIPQIINNVEKVKAEEKATTTLNHVELKNLDLKLFPSELSGGMQKRLAIARTLCLKPDIIFYDEPTSGLDPESALKITKLIKKINYKNENLTSFTITHDYESALTIADKIYFLDKKNYRLVEIFNKEKQGKLTEIQLNDLVKNIVSTSVDEIKNKNTTENKNLYRYIESFLERIGNSILLQFKLGLPYKFKDMYRYLKDFGLNSVLLIVIIGFFIGILVTLQFYEGTESVRELIDIKLPSTIVYNLFMLFSPIVTGLLLSGRIATKISADVASKNYLNQIDAMKTMNIDHHRLHLAPMFYSLLVISPLLVFVFASSASFGSYILWSCYSLSSQYFLSICFENFTLSMLIFIAIRGIIIGNIISLMSYQIGMEPKTSSGEVANSTTSAFIFCSIIIIGSELILNYLYTFV